MLRNHLLSFCLIAAAFIVIEPFHSFAHSTGSPKKWVIEKNSTLRIEGKSNVNSFNCDIEEYHRPDTIAFFDNNTSKAVRLTGSLKLEILKFNCHSMFITRDFRKTLKASEYPGMTIRFLSLQSMPAFQKDETIKGWVEVQLAGITKQFEICYSFSKSGELVQLNGSRNFCFSDFNLVPPRKLAGLIQIQDDFKVNFRLMLRPVD
jgi:hypothetical protein